MKKYTVAFPSVTIASKAKYVLETAGYEARLIRTPKTLASGCGYSVATNANAAAITSLLEQYGINYKAISESGS